MHIYFAGIGGAGIGPLSTISAQLGHKVSGSDTQEPPYMADLKKAGINVTLDQSGMGMQAIHEDAPIDWLVYSSALPLNNPNHPELKLAKDLGIKSTKRDQLLSYLIKDNQMKLLAIAGTHGKSTTTAMAVWLMQELGLSFGYSVGAKLPFGPMGAIAGNGEWFIYECDEFDRNFLSFDPDIALISGLGYDHHEIFPTKKDYNNAFIEFMDQSQQVFIWPNDADYVFEQKSDPDNVNRLDYRNKVTLAGKVNQLDAELAVAGVAAATGEPTETLYKIINRFPGVSRRFEKLAKNIYTDYAHTPEKVAGALDTAGSLGQPVVAVYEPLTNRRQHYIKDEYYSLFDSVDTLLWVPSYLAREDESLNILSPSELIKSVNRSVSAQAAEMDEELYANILEAAKDGKTVVLMSGGGAGSLDSWIRQQLKA